MNIGKIIIVLTCHDCNDFDKETSTCRPLNRVVDPINWPFDCPLENEEI